MSMARQEKQEKRFQFGKNWRSFLATLNEERIKIAENSIRDMLGLETLDGLRFLDIGSGSGLFSLAARRLGATVYSFDFDPSSVACTQELRSRYFPADQQWNIARGSVLDSAYLNSLGKFDIVYSWGVLHHTGDMWQALDNAARPVDQNGILFLAIYNDQGRKSKRWWKVKNLYCSGLPGRILVCTVFIPYFFAAALKTSILNRQNIFRSYKKNRGMSIIHDWIDWLGGFPFEVAKVEDIFNFFRNKGFVLINLKTTAGLGNNQFVFTKK